MDHQTAIDLLVGSAPEALGESVRAELEAHLAQCEPCRARAETYRLLQRGLAAHLELQETRHPSSDDLAALARDPKMLAQTDATALEAHLDDCPDCRHEMELVRRAFGRTKRFVARPWFDLALAGSRIRHPRRQALAAALALLLALGGGVLYSLLSGPARKHRIAGQQLEGKRVIEAGDSITAAAVEVSSGSDVTFRAGSEVILEDGFVVGMDAEFKVELKTTSTGERPKG